MPSGDAVAFLSLDLKQEGDEIVLAIEAPARRREDRRRPGRCVHAGARMSGRRQATGLGAIVGVGALAALCCVAIPAALGAVAGAAIGGAVGEGAAALRRLRGGRLLYRRRKARGSRC